jgi:enediyne biosynthesis protein E4
VTGSRGRARVALLVAVFAVAAGTGAWFAFRASRPEAPSRQPRAEGAYSAPPAIPEPDEPPPELLYVDVTKTSGIDFVHETGARGKKLLPETMGAGCGFLDYDADGDPDLLLLNGDYWSDDPRRSGPRPTSRLYRNDGAWKFTDVTKQVGLDQPIYAMGCSAADVDADGDLDLFISGVGGYRFLRNDQARFVDVSAESGLVPGGWTDEKGREHGCFATSAAFLDYDKDGKPDLFVCHYVRWSEETDVWSTMDGKTKSYAIPTQYQGETCRLWRNLGGGRFDDVTDKARVRNDEGKSLGVCILDVDEDGWPDIAVANDTQPNYLYRNNKDGTFTDVALDCGVSHGPDGRARAGMGISSGCVTGCRQSIVIGNFSGEPVSLLEQLPDKPWIMVNKADQYGAAVVTHPMLTFGVAFLDADLDGFEDLVLANGHIEPTIQSVHKETTYEQPMQLLRNVKGKRFVDVSKSVGADFTKPRVGRGLAYADLDDDGDLDLCLTTNGGPPALLRCDLQKRGVRVTVGKSVPSGALGAKVTVSGDGWSASKTVRTGSSYLSLSEPVLTFGLPADRPATGWSVVWPDGTKFDSLEPLEPGRKISAGVVR